MTIVAGDEDGPIRNMRSKSAAVGRTPAKVRSWSQSPPTDPGARRQLSVELAQPFAEFLLIGRVFQGDLAEPHAA